MKPDMTSYAMFSITDFVPTVAGIVGATMPNDQPIDRVDQSNVLFGKSARLFAIGQGSPPIFIAQCARKALACRRSRDRPLGSKRATPGVALVRRPSRRFATTPTPI
jgi:hypothetical protein